MNANTRQSAFKDAAGSVLPRDRYACVVSINNKAPWAAAIQVNQVANGGSTRSLKKFRFGENDKSRRPQLLAFQEGSQQWQTP